MAELRAPDPPLRDAVVALRPWRADDVPERVMLFADPSVLARSWAGEDPYTEADARAFFAWQAQARVTGEALCLALCAPDDDTHVLGGGSLYELVPDEGRVSVGYWLTPAARGRGVATCATRLMVSWAFRELGVARAELTCAPDNLPSQAVAERCGFVREAVLRSHMAFRGARRDSVVYGLLASDLPGS